MAAGVQASAAASGSESDFRSDSNTNAEVYAGQDLTVKSGQDTAIAGANLEGDKVFMDVGGDLNVASRQDTSDSKSSNWSIGGTATVGAGASAGLDIPAETGDSANIGTGKGSGSTAWVNQQTSIIGREQVDIRVEGNTHVEGAVIAAENGNLKLDTDTLTYQDIYDHDKAENQQASLSGSISAENEKNNERTTGEDGNPYAGTAEGSYSSHDRQQITRATIGEGEIIIRSDPAAGLEGLNRDLAKAQEITKDEKTSVTVYIDSSAIAEVASGGAGIKENFKKTIEKIKELLPKEAERVHEILAAQQATYETLVAQGMTEAEAAKIIAGNPLLAVWMSELAPYTTENGELAISEAEADQILAKLLNDPLVSVNLADSSAEITYLSETDRAKLQFWTTVNAIKRLGASSIDALGFAYDYSGEVLYWASGGQACQAEHESFSQTVNDLYNSIVTIATDPVAFGKAVADNYKERYEQYEDFTAQGKFQEAGEVLGGLVYDLGETVIAAGAAGAGVFKSGSSLGVLVKNAAFNRRIVKELAEVGVTDVKKISADMANAPFVAKGWNAPYADTCQVRQFTTNQEIGLVRVYAEGTNLPIGRFLVRAEEIAGLTPQQIQQYLALPQIPTHIADVKVPVGVKMQAGRIAAQSQFGAPDLGVIQYQLLEDIPIQSFINMRTL